MDGIFLQWKLLPGESSHCARKLGGGIWEQAPEAGVLQPGVFAETCKVFKSNSGAECVNVKKAMDIGLQTALFLLLCP